MPANENVTPRRRRTTAEILERLLEAAGKEFEQNGYERTKTAAIARKAEVTEALIFNHFGTKANLFQEAIFKPLNAHFQEFSLHHVVAPGDTQGLQKETTQYVNELQDFVGAHSRMLMSLVVERLYASDTGEGVGPIEGLERYFEDVASLTLANYEGELSIEPGLLARISFATIFSCVLFKDWLFPGGKAGDDQVRAAISRFIINGLGRDAGEAD